MSHHPPNVLRGQPERLDDIEGTLASVASAAILAGISPREVLQGVGDGRIRQTKKRNKVVVSVADTDRLALDLGREGAPR